MFLLLIVIILVGLMLWWGSRKKKENYTTSNNVDTKSSNDEIEGVVIHNHLSKTATIKNGSTNYARDIRPNSTLTINSDDVENNFYNTNFTITVDNKVYNHFTINTPQNQSVRNIHIGQNTSRWVGAKSDYNFTPANAQQGLPYVTLHNRTSRTLRLNNNTIVIDPNGSFKYKGRDHFGVRLGTIFTDDYRLLQPFKFETPATDIYFGVVSDLEQVPFGGWQLDENFNDSSSEPQFLLENGWMGGPDNKNIDYSSVPIDGKVVGQWNRWGQRLD